MRVNMNALNNNYIFFKKVGTYIASINNVEEIKRRKIFIIGFISNSFLNRRKI